MSPDELMIFSDGFKGAPDGWKRILPINFLVGENSTGKTSVLELISLIDEPQFLLGNEIQTTDENFNVADDIISRLKGGNYVSVGLLASEKKPDENAEIQYSGKVCTYMRDGTDLKIKFITLLNGRSFFKLKSRGDAILCKRNFDDLPLGASIKEAAHFLSEIHQNEQTGFQKVIEAQEGKALHQQAWTVAELQAQAPSPSKNKKKGRRFRPIFTDAPFNSWQYGPIRGETQRYYHGPGRKKFDPKGSHYPFLLRSIIERESDAVAKINNFGAESGLFDRIIVKKVSEKKKDSPFSIKLLKDGKEFFADELGYGVIQVLPIITELLVESPRRTILFQQPEVHLHPRAQAALGEMLHAAASSGSYFLIETHSDYIIDRFRKCQKISEKKVTAQLIFFEFDKEKHRNILYEIDINDGGMLEDVPPKYREFFIDEEISNFELL